MFQLLVFLVTLVSWSYIGAATIGPWAGVVFAAVLILAPFIRLKARRDDE